MASRHRIHDWIGPNLGFSKRILAGSTTTTTQDNTLFPAYRGDCLDVVGNPGGDNSLVLEKWSRDVVPLDGTYVKSVIDTQIFSNWIATTQRQVPAHLSFSAGNNAQDAITVLARSNPNRAEMNLPVSIFELKDLPRMLQFAGKTTLKRGSNQFLNWEFGWAPLLSDLRKLMEFNVRTERRVREFHSLYNKGGLRRRIRLQEDNKEDASTINIETSLGTIITARQCRFSTRRRWGTVRWTPTSLPIVDETKYSKLARQLVFDIQPSMSNLWQAMPWSWFIDWFVNVGDFIEANKNTIPVTHSPVNIMEEKVTKVSYPVSNAKDFGYGVHAGTGVAIRQSKLRAIVPGVSASVTPFLTGRQLSILGALFITKHKPRGWTS